MLYLTRAFMRRVMFLFMGFFAFFKCNAALAMFFSMLVSVFAYAQAFGIWYAIGLVLLLFAHEFGHVMAARTVGVASSWPLFIPFMGAVVRLGRAPVNVKAAANIAIGGPALGTLSALFCMALFFWTDSLLLLVLAYTGCLLNLFNLIPCDPLDGGKIGEAISPHLWRLGSCVIAGLLFYTGNALIFCIFLFSLRKLWKAPAGAVELRYYQLTGRQRLKVFFWYIGLIAVLGAATLYIGKLL